jgi:hypothetical protein
MEVHAHSHTARKKWTHYLWEFLMLFLAVFCGFLAENFREGQVERHREKEYMRSLIQDLNADISEINGALEFGAVIAEKLDSVVYILNEKDPDKNAYDLYRLGAITGGIVVVSFNDRTASQLKNAGTMRLIRNADLSDSIQNYWTSVKDDESLAQKMFDMQVKSGDLWVQMSSNKYIERKDPSNPSAVSIKKDAKLINSDARLIVQLSNRTRGRCTILNFYLAKIRETKEMALRLIDLIKKEYHLK